MMLVTGATGHFGARVAESLLGSASADGLAVSVREPEKAGDLRSRGVDVRHGDFNDPASLDTAFAGVNRLLIVSTDGDNDTRIRQHLAAVAAAKKAGVGFIAYTSIAKADSTHLSLGPVHRATEQAIRETGIAFSLLRNNWYAENEASVIKAVLAGAPLVTSAGDGKVGWAARADYAQAAAAVLAGDGHENTTYQLSGPPRTYDDFAAILSRVIGRDVPVQHIDDASYRARLSGAGLPAELAEFLTGLQASIREGALEVRSDDLTTLLGRPPTPLEDVVKQIAADTSPAPS